jgi:hypothetical protein
VEEGIAAEHTENLGECCESLWASVSSHRWPRDLATLGGRCLGASKPNGSYSPCGRCNQREFGRLPVVSLQRSTAADQAVFLRDESR